LKAQDLYLKRPGWLHQFAGWCLEKFLLPSRRQSVHCSAMAKYTLHVNGQVHQVDADPEMPLLWVLRDLLQLTGTKYGCGIGICGACTVHEDGQGARSCEITLANAVGREYVTIEGLSASGDHPCQRAWIEEDVSQCGYCQAGMTMTAAALLAEKPRPTDVEIDAVMSELVCRCGTYQRIRKAIHRAASEGKAT
jgi:aerobic-type carbon monoxide dehydrogenase small subunit (CoxS/CutS family)